MIKRMVLLAVIVSIIAIITKIYVDTNVFKVETVRFQSNKIPAGAEFTVLQISDLHSKVFGRDNETLLQAIADLDADVIVLTGDLIDRSTKDFQPVFSLVEQIVSINSEVYFVSGNHEWANARTDDFLQGLRDRNVAILNNRSAFIEINGIPVHLVGVDDVSTRHEDVHEAFDGVDPGRYTVLLSHAPNIVEEYRNLPADLILSGHTHGGQVRMPFVGALVAPDQGWFPELDKGTYTIGEHQYLYIDSGLGTSVAPFRFLNQSQMSLITIAN